MHVALPKSRGGQMLARTEQPLGFLAAGRDNELGYLGGYLITTIRGRPLEFHYTSPVKPSATHRILYGAELEPYIYGELIASNLVRQSKTEPVFLITDQPVVLHRRSASTCPILCCAVASGNPSQATGPLTHPEFTQDRDAVQSWMQEADSPLNLSEPFDRIWEALRAILKGEAAGQGLA